MLKKLRPLLPRQTILTDFYVFDTEKGRVKDGVIKWELDGTPETFIFGCIVGHNFRKILYTVEDFKKEFQDSRYKNKYVFAHNAEFDLTSIYSDIFELDPNAIFNGKFITATNGNAKFADSMNIYNTSVREIGKLLGMEKIGMDGDKYDTSDWNNPDQKFKDIEGCYRDCEIIYDALVQIFEDAGDIKITQASLSLTYFRRFHQKHTIEHNENTAFFWDSYFGGRVECFKLGKTNATVIDINSSYPYAMKHCIFPNPKFLKVSHATDVNNFLNNVLPNFEGCVYCTVNHPETFFGFLPKKQGGKLIFPVGQFSGVWNFNELRFALQNGVTILKIERFIYAERMASPFTAYVDNIYKQRLTAKNEFEKWRLKIFANSLYGKFAQRIDEDTIYIKDVTKELDKIKQAQKDGIFVKLQMFSQTRLDAFLITKSTRNISLNYSIPSFASYITSFSRVHLAKEMLNKLNKGIVYCDTDSIFYEINCDHLDSMELGGWKVENKVITEVLGLKNYRYIKDGKALRRLKGVPSKATVTGANTFEYFNVMKSKESLRRKTAPGKLTKRTKKILGLYTKRTVLNDGTTKPLVLCLD